MAEFPNVVIVLARCSKSRLLFGIRFEEITSKNWSGTWAFQIKEGRAQREGYGQNQITGTFLFDSAYPGCPECQDASTLVICSCNKVSCWDGETRNFICPWCESAGKITGVANRLFVNNDR